jgi:hypothetical protein
VNLNNYANKQVNISIKVEELVEIDAALKALIEEIEGVSESGYFKSIGSYDLLDIKKIQEEFLDNFQNNKLANYAFKEFRRLNSFEYILNPDSDDNDVLSGLDRKIDLLRGSEIFLSMRFYSLGKLFDITSEYANENSRRDMLADRDDWMPPENFKDGTDEEQEIWKMHYGE